MRIPEQELTLRDLARIVRRRSALICLVAGGVFALAVLLWALSPRQYEATGTLRIHGQRANSLNNLLTGVPAAESGPADALSADIEVQSQANLLQTNELALRTMHKLDLASTADFRTLPAGDQEKQLALFHHRLSVKPVGGTSMVQVSFLDSDPKVAAAVVNDLALELSDQAYEQQAHTTELASRTLREQLSDLRTRSEQLQTEVAGMQRASGIYSIGTTDAEGRPQAYSAVLAQFERAASVLSSADENRILKQGIVQAAEAGDAELLSSLAGNGPLSAGGGSSFSTLQALRTQQATLEGQLKQMQVKFGQGYSRLAELQANLDSINGAIHDEVQRIGKRAATDFEVADRTYQNAHKDYERQKTEADALNDRAIRYVMARQEADETRALYEDLLKRLKEAGIFEALHAGTVELSDPALVPSQPAKPRTLIFLGAGLGAGLFLGSALALLLELLGDKLHDADEFRELGIPVAGVLPNSKRLWRRQQALLAREGVMASVQAVLLRSTANVDTPIILLAEVTGQTKPWTLPFTLAQGLAAEGKRVLLLEADACSPVCDEVSASDDPAGKPALLAAPPAPKALPKPKEAISIVRIAEGTPAVFDLLDKRTRDRQLDQWRADFDIVLVQAAPVLPFAAGQLLAECADAVVLSAVLGLTSRTSVLRAHEALRTLGANRTLFVAEEGKAHGAYEDFYGLSVRNVRAA